jgi:hypothetical protein
VSAGLVDRLGRGVHLQAHKCLQNAGFPAPADKFNPVPLPAKFPPKNPRKTGVPGRAKKTKIGANG